MGHRSAVHVIGPIISIINSTFADNTATTAGGVLWICTSHQDSVILTTIRNSIFWGNTAGDGSGDGNNFYKACGGAADYLTISDSDADLYYPDYAGGKSLTGTGNMLISDPLFVDADADIYHIQSGSPVRGQASASYAPDDDIDGQSRPYTTGDSGDDN